MTTIERRVSDLESARERQERRKNGPIDDVERVRLFLESVDGQHDLDMRPGEDISSVMTRRMMHLDGWNLNALPGHTEAERWHSADLAANNENFEVSAEARHAARHCIKIYEGI